MSFRRSFVFFLLKNILNNFTCFFLSAIGSVFFGDHKEIFESSLNLMLFGPNHVPSKQQFDMKVLVS